MKIRTQCAILVLLGAWRASQDDKQKAAESLAALNTWLTSHANLDNTSESRQDEKQKGGTVEDVERDAEQGEKLEKNLARALKVLERDKTPLNLRNGKTAAQ
mmetsp:Transcript_39148/g.57541  ORF Transcript_39148/g.57541 Transcript_39148/m.57541 type:complete len:102 (-) Transcript_39148:249-554(-)